jgi:hypothetical protein
MSLSKTRGGDTIIPQDAPGKPKGLIGAYSEIEQYYNSERKGTDISEKFFTMSGKMLFWEIGFKGALASGLVSVLLTPFAMGVWTNTLPIFGSYTPSWYDKFFALMCAMGFTVGYALFFGSLGKFYIGEITKCAIHYLLQGVILAAVLKGFVAFMAFNYIYFVLLDPGFLADHMIQLKGFIAYNTLNRWFNWWLAFKPVFLLSSYFVVITTLILIIVPIWGVYHGSKKIEKIIEQEKEWS